MIWPVATILSLVLYLAHAAYQDRRRGVPVNIDGFVELFFAMLPFWLVGMVVVMMLLNAGGGPK